jgi:hypothetical protein
VPDHLRTQRDANRVIAKSGELEFYCQFFFRGHWQLGADRKTDENRNDVLEEWMTPLQGQSDQKRDRILQEFAK